MKIISQLKENEIFVFGSNEAGIHGAGAALQAMQDFGAKFSVGFGPQGQTFAIPTKDWTIKTLPVKFIKPYVDSFLSYTQTRPDLTFLVTEIGCGLAGYTPEDIAPLFKMIPYLKDKNVILPDSFIKALQDRFESI
jgi:hypothetical protein